MLVTVAGEGKVRDFSSIASAFKLTDVAQSDVSRVESPHAIDHGNSVIPCSGEVAKIPGDPCSSCLAVNLECTFDRRFKARLFPFQSSDTDILLTETRP